MNNKDTILSLFGFDTNSIDEISYLINLSKILGIEKALLAQIEQFDRRPNETYPNYYKRMMLGEISWRINELICASFHPDIAVDRLEDYCLFFQDYCLDDEIDNDIYNYIMSNNLTLFTLREIVGNMYLNLIERYEEYFDTTDFT